MMLTCRLQQFDVAGLDQCARYTVEPAMKLGKLVCGTIVGIGNSSPKWSFVISFPLTVCISCLNPNRVIIPVGLTGVVRGGLLSIHGLVS